jgi:hypothetical protein
VKKSAGREASCSGKSAHTNTEHRWRHEWQNEVLEMHAATAVGGWTDGHQKRLMGLAGQVESCSSKRG